MSDVLTATQDGVFAALSDGVPPERAKVLVHVKQDTEPNMVIVADMEIERQGKELFRVEFDVHTIYRGGDRGELLAIMQLVFLALDGVTIEAEGFDFGAAQLLRSAASTAGADGVTYAGISSFEVYAEPA